MILIYLMVAHFIADFLLQSREMGKKKSSEWRWLLKHLGIQFGVFFLVVPLVVANKICTQGEMDFPEYMNDPKFWTDLLIPFSLKAGFWFSFFNALVHGLIDWNIWKLYKLSAYIRMKYEKDKHLYLKADGKTVIEDKWFYWEDHWFYTTIGFDQLLHASTIVALAYWIALL